MAQVELVELVELVALELVGLVAMVLVVLCLHRNTNVLMQQIRATFYH
jgi:hypothetical protein